MSQTTKVITGIVRLSYAHLFTPTAVEEGNEKKYSVSLIIPKKDKETVKKIQDAIALAIEEGKDKLGGKSAKSLKTPLRDGDEEREDDPAYENAYFINANSKKKPGLIDKEGEPITDEEDLYSGCYGRASITFFAFNTSGNKGIACGLNHIMKVKDGEPLGSTSKATDDFADLIGAGDDDDDLI